MPRFSTREVPVGNRVHAVNALWAEWYGVDLPWEPTHDDPLDVDVNFVPIDQLLLSIHHSSAALQTNRSINARNRRFRYFVHMATSGTQTLEIAGRTVRLQANDFTVTDAAKPCNRSQGSTAGTLTLAIDSERLKRFVPPIDQVVGAHFDASGGMPKAISSMLRSMGDLESAGSIGHFGGRFANGLLEMFGLCCEDMIQRTGGTPVGLERALRIKAYIDEHLLDPALSVGSVAAALGLSPRYLHMLFAAHFSTVSTYIREQRLQMCCRRLASPSWAGRSITEIAFACGFGDLSHFSRQFRAAFGVSPSQYRAQPVSP